MELHQTASNKPFRRIYSVNQIVALYPAITTGGLRALIFYNTDGFVDKCVIRVRRKVMIDADALDEWLDTHRGKQP